MRQSHFLLLYYPHLIDGVVLLQALSLEACLRAPWNLRRKAFVRIDDILYLVEHLQHLVGIVLPVGDTVDVSAFLELGSQKPGKRYLDQALLMAGMPIEDMLEYSENIFGLF